MEKDCSIVTYEYDGKRATITYNFFLDKYDTKVFFENKNSLQKCKYKISTAGGYDSETVEFNLINITMISKISYDECSFISSNNEQLDEYIGKYYE